MAVRTRWTGGRALAGEPRTAWEWEGEGRTARPRRRGGRGRWALVRARDADRSSVHVQVLDPGPVTPDLVRALCTDLAAESVHHLVTNAMSPADAAPFLDAGFRIQAELDLLARPLGEPLSREARTHRTRDRAAVLALDHIAFGADGFDAAALDAALHATTAVRLRVVGRGSIPQGYAITGAAGRRGYVQRLAVHPDARRRGIGGALLADGLRWARRRGAQEAVVNTNRDNTGARLLYESHGFVELPIGLVVLERAQ
jgi:ribosomal protein S18 acetylase RimI-like enzyme